MAYPNAVLAGTLKVGDQISDEVLGYEPELTVGNALQVSAIRPYGRSHHSIIVFMRFTNEDGTLLGKYAEGDRSFDAHRVMEKTQEVQLLS